ncbi:hypothetical protein ACSBR1_015330 [Camellia fascicularis]
METDVGDSSIHPEIVTKTFSEYDLFINRKRSKKMKNVRSEFDHCLEDDVFPRTFGFDVLNWWKANGPKYLTLQAIARDILAIHVSIVASKSAFSTSERSNILGIGGTESEEDSILPLNRVVDLVPPVRRQTSKIYQRQLQ